MPFEFVDNNAAFDHATKKRIRIHVARGKNRGRKLARPSRKKALDRTSANTTAVIHVPKLVEESRSMDCLQKRIPGIERQVGDGLSVLSIPEQTSASSGFVQRAFAFISQPRHASELKTALEATPSPPASMWVQLMFVDEAYFHCAMAVALTALNDVVTEKEYTSEALRHLSQTLRLVNGRLSGLEAVSDITMAVIVMLIKYEPLHGRYRRGLFHLDGLQRMIQMRGGITQLARENPELAQKIFRTDLEYSFHLVSKTIFAIEDVVPTSTAIVGLPGIIEVQGERAAFKPIDACLPSQLSSGIQNLLIDINTFAWLLNLANGRRGPRLNAYAFHDTIILLGYRLIATRPMNGPYTSRVEKAAHMGLMAFIMSFFRKIDGRIMQHPLLYEIARLATRDYFEDEQKNQELLLWILFIGGVSIFRLSDDAWLFPEITQIMCALDLRTWEGVSQKLVKFPWVHAVHDKSGRALWYRLAATTDINPQNV